MRMASCGLISNACKVMVPRRSIPELATNTPSVGRLGAQSGFRAWCVGPTLSRTRKWTQPQERKKAKTGGAGGGVGERRVKLAEELVELKGRNLKLPNRRASSLALEWLSEVKRATSERPGALLDWKNWERDNGGVKKETLCILFYHQTYEAKRYWEVLLQECSRLCATIGRSQTRSVLAGLSLHHFGPPAFRAESSSTPAAISSSREMLSLRPAERTKQTTTSSLGGILTLRVHLLFNSSVV